MIYVVDHFSSKRRLLLLLLLPSFRGRGFFFLWVFFIYLWEQLPTSMFSLPRCASSVLGWLSWFFLLKIFWTYRTDGLCALHFALYYSCFFKNTGTGERRGRQNNMWSAFELKCDILGFNFWQVDVSPASSTAGSRNLESSQSRRGGKSKQSVRHEGGEQKEIILLQLHFQQIHYASLLRVWNVQ